MEASIILKYYFLEVAVIMPRNVEIKARVSDPEKLKQKASELANGEPTVIIQRDTFFNVPNGRLKLREKGVGKH